MSLYKTIREISEQFNMTRTGVRYWVKSRNIPHKYEKVEGHKRRYVVDIEAFKKAINENTKLAN